MLGLCPQDSADTMSVPTQSNECSLQRDAWPGSNVAFYAENNFKKNLGNQGSTYAFHMCQI